MGRLTPERPPYTVISLDDVEEVPALAGALRWKPVRRTLGVQAFGINAYAADAGSEVVETHDARSLAGDHDAALEIMAGASGDHTGNPAFHYNHACLMVRAGRLDEAVAELARAHGTDPERIARWARDDADLDPLRDRPDWPLR